MEKVLKHIYNHRLMRAGERVAIACSGGADSVALLRILVELRQEIGIVLSVAHFNHQIRGVEAEADSKFVEELAAQFQLVFHHASQDVPALAAARKISIETAAREMRYQWLATLIQQGKVDKIATAHTLDDQAETVLMRMIRGTGVRGLAGIAPEHREKHLVRPLLAVTRRQIESYLTAIGQPWREDSSNQDASHTRNRVRHTLLPLLEQQFNPDIRQTLADLAELAGAEENFWSAELVGLLQRFVREGRPSRSGRTQSGESYGVLALDLADLRALPVALQRLLLHGIAEKLGVCLEFKHIQQLALLADPETGGKKLVLPDDLVVIRSARELQFTRLPDESPENYRYSLPIPGEVAVKELGCTIRASVISAGKQKVSGYNAASLLNPTLLGPELIVRNWRAGDRFFPAHSQSPKKVKELLQPARLDRQYSAIQRKHWPVIESAGQIVWMKGFSVSRDFTCSSGEAVLIEVMTNEC